MQTSIAVHGVAVQGCMYVRTYVHSNVHALHAYTIHSQASTSVKE